MALPSASSESGDLDVRRPDIYFSPSRPEVIRLEVTPPPLLLLHFNGDIDKLVYWMQRMAEEGTRELQAASKGRTPLGARKLRRMHPWSEPRTLRETRGSRVPTFRIGARGITGRRLHIQGATEVRQFRHGYHGAMGARLAGDLNAEFPFGTYHMCHFHGAPVAEAPQAGEALITAPGPLLCDVLELLEQERQARAQGQSVVSRDTIALCNDIRTALREEASELCEHASEAMDFEGLTAHVRTRPAETDHPPTGDVDAADKRASAETPTGDVIVRRHRFARNTAETDRGARRVVIHRDQRRGRPVGTKHGADPPD